MLNHPPTLIGLSRVATAIFVIATAPLAVRADNPGGAAIYAKQCMSCHGKNGEGNRDKFYPVIAGQHYKYLLRQMTNIRDGKRRNANPDMVKIIKKYTDTDLVAISAYQSSLEMPGAMCKAGTAKK